MPQFILPVESAPAIKTYTGLSTFAQGYIQAMFFTDASDADDGDLADATFDELAPESLAKIEADCAKFQHENEPILERAYSAVRKRDIAYTEESAGMDFWYSRNGHGVGYFDRGLGGIGDALHKAAKRWREVHVYRGDDGKVYVD